MLHNRFVLIPILTGNLLLVMCCVMAIAFGDLRNPQSDPRADALDMCQDNACFMGQIPGESSWLNARETFPQSTSPQRANYIQITIPPDDKLRASFFRSANQETVGRIHLRFDLDAEFHIGWLVERFGEPCRVTWYRNSRLTLHYPFLVASAQLKESTFDVHTGLQSLDIYDPAFFTESPSTICEEYIGTEGRNTDWKGFAPRWYYFASASS